MSILRYAPCLMFALVSLTTVVANADTPNQNANTLLPGTGQSSILPAAKTREVDALGMLQLESGHPYSLVGTYGSFTSPDVELGGTVGYFGGDNTRSQRFFGGVANYHIRQRGDLADASPLVPYLGLFAGYAINGDKAFSIGGQGGIKYFVNQNAAILCEYEYRSVKSGSNISELIFGFGTFFH
ncbi:MAG: hypothetical protein P4L33_06085 [Capsulimonadaceae bacterium]|nr:hypothetical protein [Capsulimonadaceae bacterium]